MWVGGVRLRVQAREEVTRETRGNSIFIIHACERNFPLSKMVNGTVFSFVVFLQTRITYGEIGFLSFFLRYFFLVKPGA